MLRIRRRRVLELARARVPALAAALDSTAAYVHHTLVYATDKDPGQLGRVHEVLEHRGLIYHQVTARETAAGQLAERLLADFDQGHLQLLTAKRVLDEGINVPGIRCAHVLASTTVQRQWVQRLGRVLRLDPASAKDHATYHDYLALPSARDGRDDDARKMIEAELDRVRWFGEHARNSSDRDGWLSAANHITATYFA